MRVWFLLFLVVGAAAQGPGAYESVPRDEASVHAPVQLLLDQVPQVLRHATREASFDTTPDTALSLVADMQAFLSGFDAVPPWPEAAVASGADAPSTYGYVGQIIDVTARIPAEAGRLARFEGSCAAWNANATVGDWRAWRRNVDGAHGALAAFGASLELLADQVPPRLDPTPVRQAVKHLDDWGAPVFSAADGCLVELEERLIREGLLDPETVQEHLAIWLVPERSWPTGRVAVLGRASGPVQVTAPSLGWNATGDGVFRLAFEIPRDASLGIHAISAAAGTLRAEAQLTVAKAPLSLELTAPRRAAPGATVEATVHLRTPAPQLVPDDATLVATGAVDGLLPVDSRRAHASLVAPQEGVVQATFRFHGTDALAAAQVTWTLIVAEPGTAAAPGAAGGGADGPGGAGGTGAQAGDGAGEGAGGVGGTGADGDGAQPGGRGGIPFFPEIPAEPLLFLALVLAVVAVLGILELVALVRRRKGSSRRVYREPAPEGPVVLPEGLVAAFAAFVAWLTRLGLVRRSWTAREVGRRIDEAGVRSWSLVRAFEDARYAGAPERHPGKARKWLRMLQDRFGGPP